MTNSISNNFFIKEQAIPILTGLGVATLYYGSYKKVLDKEVLKTHTLGLMIGSVATTMLPPKNLTSKAIVSLLPLALSLIPSLKKYRIHEKEFLVFYLCRLAIELSLLPFFTSKQKNQIAIQPQSDDEKLELAKSKSLSPIMREDAKAIAESINDPDKKFRAILILAKNKCYNIQNVRAKFSELLNQVTDHRLIEKMEFEIAKKGEKAWSQVIVPPKSCDRTGISEQQWSTIQKTFDTIHNRGGGVHIDFKQNVTTFFLTDRKNLSIPFESRLITRNEAYEFVILLPKLIGAGAEKKVYLAYNLTTGKYYARKELRQQELKVVQSIPRKRGIPKIVSLPTASDKQECLQPLYDHNLLTAIRRNTIKTRQEKLFVIEQIFKALIHVHTRTYLELPLMHGDIKLENIVIKTDNLKVMLIDFGHAIYNSSISGSLGYWDPMAAKLRKSYHFPTACNQLACTEYNKQFGQKRDVWATGLVIASLFFGVNLKCDLPNIPFLLDAYTGNTDDKDSIRKNISKLSQQAVDEALNDKNSEPLLPLLKGMLRVNPGERLTMEQAFNMFNSIVSQSSGHSGPS